MAALQSNISPSSSSFRFMGLLKQPDSDPLELDESDVVWSADYSSENFAFAAPPPPPPPGLHRPHTHFKPSTSGLSAALAGDCGNLVRRKSTLNPSFSAAASAARVIPAVNSRPSSHGVAKFHQSAPVNVPVWAKKNTAGAGVMERCEEAEVEDELDDEDEEMVPPHVIVARSHVTFSVFEGVGRTLKGRDLRRVRNAVFQKTGFID
nr:Chaperone protein like [Ipomoea batatas]